MAFDIGAFDEFLSKGAVQPTHVFGHPDALATLYGYDPVARYEYAQWYNVRHPIRRVRWDKLNKDQTLEAGKMFIRSHAFVTTVGGTIMTIPIFEVRYRYKHRRRR